MKYPFLVRWQPKALRISGKGVPYGKKFNQRVVLISKHIQALLEYYFAIHECCFFWPAEVQKMVKRV